MNMGILPVTGITVPFMSYGGSHLLVEFTGLGILMSMRRYARAAHRDVINNEFLGI
jgi:rod shape determining protein RodA